MRLLIRLVFSLLLSAGLARPAAVSTVSLDGDWHFLADPNGTLDVQKLDSVPYVRPTRIPSSWQSQFADLRDYAGVAWYWRTIAVEPPAADQVALVALRRRGLSGGSLRQRPESRLARGRLSAL